MAKQPLKYVGQNVPRVDGVEKVTGQARFLGDLVVPGMLQGKIIRSSYPHAKIISIDSSKAEALEGTSGSRRRTGSGYSRTRGSPNRRAIQGASSGRWHRCGAGARRSADS